MDWLSLVAFERLRLELYGLTGMAREF